MLTGKYWITPEGSINLDAQEHAQLALHYMLNIPADRLVPMWWTMRGVPPEELAKALDNGASKDAVDFLSDKKADARYYVVKKFGWVRTQKSAFNLYRFDAKIAKMIRDAKEYWAGQKNFTEFDMIDIYEFETNEQYTIKAIRLLDGGKPEVLKRLAMGVADDVIETASPVYSAAKFSELERDRLYARSGANPRRRSR